MDTTAPIKGITGLLTGQSVPQITPVQTSRQPVQPEQQSELDPQAVNLAKAIRQHESGGDFTARGKSGEYGAYQYTPDTWNTDSQKYLGQSVSLEQATPEQQNEVAYKKIKELKDQGNNVGQIASIWNSGSPEWEGKTGTNSYGVQYDVPKYVDSVSSLYQQYKSQTPKQSQKTQDNSQSQTLGQELGGRLSDAGNALNSIAEGEKSGSSRASGILQLAGSVAGGVGDIVNKGLELIPGVKQVENLIGSGVGALAKTEAGQAVSKSIQAFSEAHPELAKDIGAGFNIITAIPIFKGLSELKGVALDATAQALKGAAEKGATNDLTEVLSRTIGGKKALQSAPDAIKTLVDERAIPTIEDGRLSTKGAYEKLSTTISDIEDNELQPALKSASTSGVNTRVPLEDLRQQALSAVKDEFKSGGNVGKAQAEVNRIFDDYKSSYGDYATLEDMNDMKRGIRKTVNFNSPKLDSDVSYHVGQTFQKGIEDSAQKLGLPNVKAINQKMANLIKAQNTLKYMENKSVKTGLAGDILKGAGTVGGEALGNVTGIPFAGAYLGNKGAGFVGKKLSGITEGILNRTAKDAVPQTIKASKKALIKGVSGALIQKTGKKSMQE